MLLSFQHLTPATISSDPSAVKSQDKHSSRKRRHHQKSRWGCDTCRKRHLKCDEQRPECGQCLYGRRSCAYPASPPTDIPENIAANNVSIQNHDPCISAMLSRISQESHCKNVNLSSLYEHFFQTTNPPWMGSPECQSILQQHAPRFIVGSPFLLHAILAFSAYHVAALTAPGNGYRHHEIVGACHYSLALETYRVAIDDESVDANALFACCMLLTLLSFRNLANDVGDGDGEGQVPNDAKTLALNTVGIRFIGGPRILAEAFERQAMLDQHLWKPLLHYCGKAYGNQDKNDGLVGSPIASRAMADLERLCRGEELEPGGPFDPALTSLRWLMQCYVADKPKMAQFTFCFAIRLDPRFLRFVEEGEPKALLVMCYWYALVRQVDQWWACHTAQTEGMKLLRYLQDTANGDVQGLLDFPAQLLGAS